jgi:hypothetical protein
VRSVDWTNHGTAEPWPISLADPWSRERLPNFFVLGFPKCGTTSVAAHLANHPEIFIPSVKEPAFFLFDDAYVRGPQAYAKSYFRDASDYPARGDATTMYIYQEYVAARIEVSCPADAHRFVVLARDPALRAYSTYLHLRRVGFMSGSFEEALQAPVTSQMTMWGGSLLDGSRYARVLRPWIQRFGREAFLFIKTEDLAAEPAACVRRLYRFLGVDDTVAVDESIEQNAAMEPRFRLSARLMTLPQPIRTTVNRIVPFPVKQRLQQQLETWDSKSTKPEALDPVTYRRLQGELAGEVAAFEELTGLDCSEWTHD